MVVLQRIAEDLRKFDEIKEETMADFCWCDERGNVYVHPYYKTDLSSYFKPGFRSASLRIYYPSSADKPTDPSKLSYRLELRFDHKELTQEEIRRFFSGTLYLSKRSQVSLDLSSEELKLQKIPFDKVSLALITKYFSVQQIPLRTLGPMLLYNVLGSKSDGISLKYKSSFRELEIEDYDFWNGHADKIPIDNLRQRFDDLVETLRLDRGKGKRVSTPIEEVKPALEYFLRTVNELDYRKEVIDQAVSEEEGLAKKVKKAFPDFLKKEISVLEIKGTPSVYISIDLENVNKDELPQGRIKNFSLHATGQSSMIQYLSTSVYLWTDLLKYWRDGSIEFLEKQEELLQLLGLLN